MASVSGVIVSTIFINRWSRTSGIVTSDVAVMASSSNWWARKSCLLAIAPLAIRCKARLRSSGESRSSVHSSAGHW